MLEQRDLSRLYFGAYAPFVIGNFIGIFLLALLLLIGWYYFHARRNDRWGNKALVCTLLLLTTLDTCFQCSRIVKLVCYHPGDLFYLLDIHKRFEDWLITLLSNLTAVAAQGFMAYKTLRFARAMSMAHGQKHKWLVRCMIVVFGVGWLSCLVFAIAMPVIFSHLMSYTQIIEAMKEPSNIICVMQNAQTSTFLAFDVLLTVSMSLELHFAKTGFAASNAILDSLVTHVVRNGLAVTTLQAVQIALFHLPNVSSAWGEFAPAILGKFYALTALSLLVGPAHAQRAFRARLDAEAPRPLAQATYDLSAGRQVRCSSCEGAYAAGSLTQRSSGNGTKDSGMSTAGLLSPLSIPPPTLGVNVLNPPEAPVTFVAALMEMDEDDEEASPKRQGSMEKAVPDEHDEEVSGGRVQQDWLAGGGQDRIRRGSTISAGQETTMSIGGALQLLVSRGKL